MAKTLDMQSTNPSAGWTTRQLRSFIREATADINREFATLRLTSEDIRKDYPQIWAQRERLIELGTGKEYKGGVALGLSTKLKPQLVMQARALRETYNILSDGERFSEAEAQARETFLRNRPHLDMSVTEYHDFVETLGAIGNHVLNEFGYESFIELYDSAIDKGKSAKNVLDAVTDVVKESRGMGWTMEDMIDAMRNKLDLDE